VDACGDSEADLSRILDFIAEHGAGRHPQRTSPPVLARMRPHPPE
jgi:hypothetical protein